MGGLASKDKEPEVPTAFVNVLPERAPVSIGIDGSEEPNLLHQLATSDPGTAPAPSGNTISLPPHQRDAEDAYSRTCAPRPRVPRSGNADLIVESVDDGGDETPLTPAPENFDHDVQAMISFRKEPERIAAEFTTQSYNRISQKPSERLQRETFAKVFQFWKESGILSLLESRMADEASSINVVVESVNTAVNSVATDKHTHMKNLQDMAKAYLIHNWVCKNTLFQNYAKFDDNDPAIVFNRRKCASMGFANLYKALADSAKLNCVVIEGQSRVSSDTWKKCSLNIEGSRLGSHQTHYWNSVKVQGMWILLDCALGSLHLHNAKAIPELAASWFYFSVPPEHLILTNVPQEDKWQLLDKPLTHSELEPLIAPNNLAFEMGIKPLLYNESILLTSSPVAKIQFDSPLNLHFNTSLFDCIEKKVYFHQAIVERSRNVVSAYVVMPHPGRFTLSINVLVHTESLMQIKEIQCLVYQIECKHQFEIATGFPKVLPPLAQNLNFKLIEWNSQNECYVAESKCGVLNMTYSIKSDTPLMSFIIADRTDEIDIRKVYRFYSKVSTLEKHDTKSIQKLSAVFPKEGWWTVCLLAVDVASSLSSLELSISCSHVLLMSYQVLALKAVKDKTYPFVHQPSIISLPDKLLSCTGINILEIMFDSELHLKFNCYLTHKSSNSKRINNFSMVEKIQCKMNTRYRLRAIFPLPGQWYVHVYSNRSLNDKSHCSYFELMFNVQYCLPDMTFAKLSQSAEDMGLQLVHTEPIEYNTDNPIAIGFFAPPSTLFSHYLQRLDEQNICQHGFTYVAPPSSSTPNYTFLAVFPHPGNWLVRLLSSKTVIMELSLHVTNATSHFGFPVACSSFHRFGTKFPPENLPYRVHHNSEELFFSFTAEENISFQCVMNSSHYTTRKHAIVHCENGKNYQIHAIFPTCGKWTIQVYGKFTAPDDQSYALLFEFCLFPLKCVVGKTFPQISTTAKKMGIKICRDLLPLPSIIQHTPKVETLLFSSAKRISANLQYSLEVEGYGEQLVMNPIAKDKNSLSCCFSYKIPYSGTWVVGVYAVLNGTNKLLFRHTVVAE